MRQWTATELPALQDEAARHGLAAKWRRHTLKDYSLELLEIGRTGLGRQRILDAQGNDETVYLDRLEEELRRGENPATRIIRKWEREWGGQVNRLIDATAYRASRAAGDP